MKQQICIGSYYVLDIMHDMYIDYNNGIVVTDQLIYHCLLCDTLL